MKQLRLEVLFGGKNKLSPALKAIMGSSNAASAALKKTRDQLRDLERQQERVATFRKLKDDVKQATQALEINKRSVAALKQQLATNPNSKLSSELKKAEAEAKRLNKVITEGRPKLMALRQELNATGLKSTDLAQHQEKLRNKIESANAAITRQQQHLKTLGLTQQQHQKYSSNVHNAAMYGAGAAMTGAGALYAMRKPIDESKKMDISENRVAAIGLGKEATREATQFARAMKTFGTSAVDNMNLVLDGATAFADVHHAKMVAPMLAKMKFANEAMFGQEQGADNEKKFMDMLKVIEMRNGLKSEKTFKDQANIIQQVITATGGRVQPEEWLNATKRGGLAVQGMTNEAFYYKMEPLVQMMGGHGYGNAAMSAYQNLYQGRTTQRAANNLAKFDLIGDPSKVKYNKTGDLAHLDIGAIKGAALFKKDQFAWMEQVLIPAINAKGITKEDDVVDVIGSFFSNRTASSLFARMYAQRENVHKNMKLNAGADNIDQLDARAQNTTSGKELEAKAKLHDAYLKFGTTILPVYTKAIQVATGALQTFTGWMERNPTLAKALGIGLLGIAASMLVIGGALVVFSPLILSMLSMRLLMASLSSSSKTCALGFKLLSAPLSLLKVDFLGLAKNFLYVGRLMMTSPIFWIVTAIAGAAYLIYRNWEPIKSFFIDVWNKVGAAFQSGITWIKGVIQSVDTIFSNNPILTFLFPLIGIPRLIIANWSSISGFFSELWTSISTGALSLWTSITTIFQPLGQWFSNAWISVKSATSEAWVGIKNIVSAAWQGLCNIFLAVTPLGFIIRNFDQIIAFLAGLKDKFLSIGANIIDGLVSGITSGFEKLKSVWFSINSYLPDFMRKRMDIHSPSRVMAGLGGHIMGGIGLGLDQGFPNLKEKFQQALNIFNPRASEAISKIDVTPALNKVRPSPSLSPRQASGSVVIQGDTITIQITQAPGQSLQQLQAMLENMLDRREREKHARIRSSYKDQV